MKYGTRKNINPEIKGPAQQNFRYLAKTWSK
jgi:hypothetical protein